MQIRCKCHGMSGSCQLKTCWKSAPDFRVVGKILKQQFRKAVLVDQSNIGSGSPLIISKNSIGRKPKHKNRSPRKALNRKTSFNINKLENSLFYYQRSPNFCDRDPSSDIPGNFCNYYFFFNFFFVNMFLSDYWCRRIFYNINYKRMYWFNISKFKNARTLFVSSILKSRYSYRNFELTVLSIIKNDTEITNILMNINS